MKRWTEADFLKATGRKPEQDDLERCNCDLAGTIGHDDCGVCGEHNMPIFMCKVCFYKPRNERIRHIFVD